MKFKPIEDRVILGIYKPILTTESGIVLPKDNQKVPQLATVLAVGDGKLGVDGKLVKMKLKEGDTVIYPKYGMVEIELDNKKFHIARESEVLAVVIK